MTNWAMARATSGNQLVFGVGLACFPCTSAAVTVDLLLGARFARSRRACGHTGGNAARASRTPYGCAQRRCDCMGASTRNGAQLVNLPVEPGDVGGTHLPASSSMAHALRVFLSPMKTPYRTVCAPSFSTGDSAEWKSNDEPPSASLVPRAARPHS